MFETKKKTNSEKINKLNKNSQMNIMGLQLIFAEIFFSEEVWSCCMLDLVLAIKVSISPGKQFDVR